MKPLVYVVIIIVVAAIIGAFFIVGSPAEERLRQFDQTRIRSLQDIQWQIVNYWQAKNKLPDDLLSLKNSLSEWSVPVDPETGSLYEYQKTGDLKFRLCANFNRAGSLRDGNYPRPLSIVGGQFDSENWKHEKGKACFERTIDPDFYKNKTQPL
ncbi:hypothetical protein HYW53_01020 [Candidatus Giovannonibacteria bacterium]|nr:hypothetical protein [Candidatus Giovannonibacteria bacterium]